MKIDRIDVDSLLYTYPPEKRFQYAGGVCTARVTSLVRVHTDDGAIGVGSAYSYPALVHLVVKQQLEPLLLGKDPTRVEELWELMYRVTRWYGRKGAAMSAIGALDTAFWDLAGQAAGVPVWALLKRGSGAADRPGPERAGPDRPGEDRPGEDLPTAGGRGAGSPAAECPAYASALLWDEPDALAAEAAGHIEAGFRRVKMRLGRSERYDREAVRAVREAIGSGADLMADASMRYDPATARSMADYLASMEVFWLEEPFQPEDLDAYAALREASPVPLAAGENEFGLQGFRELVRARAVDILQPDAGRCGGITEVLRVARLAEREGLRIATHTWSDAVTLIANAHVVSSTPCGLTVEVDRTGNPFIDELTEEPPAVRDGRLRLTDEPGLGIRLNRETVDRYRMEDPLRIPDGAYSDMVFGSAFHAPAEPYETRPPGSGPGGTENEGEADA